jgi:hypothetical protein
VRHDDEVSDVSGTEEKEPIFVVAMIWIEPSDRERICEGRRCFLE